MKILWVTTQIPCLKSGAQVRQFHLLKHLSNSNSITLLCLIKDVEQSEISILQDEGIDVFPIPEPEGSKSGKWANRYHSWAQLIFDPRPNFYYTYPIHELRFPFYRILKIFRPDIIHLDHLFVAPLAKYANNIPVVLTEHNIESQIYRRMVKQEGSFLHRFAREIEAEKLSRWEQKALRNCSICLTVSNNDAQEIRKLFPGKPVFVIPNGVDTDWFNPDEGLGSSRSGLLFFGNLDYAPNIDALFFFNREILPLIRKECPNITLSIVGSNAHEEIKALGDQKGINYIGFVEDIRTNLWRAAINIVPLRNGGGTRLKILEAMAAGLPIVSTSIGSEGLNIENGKNILIADTPEQFVKCIIMLNQQPELKNMIAQNARKLVVEEYDWKNIVPRLESVFQAAAKYNP
jgi:polysaccharide biosynthesis protein PslH